MSMNILTWTYSFRGCAGRVAAAAAKPIEHTSGCGDARCISRTLIYPASSIVYLLLHRIHPGAATAVPPTRDNRHHNPFQ